MRYKNWSTWAKLAESISPSLGFASKSIQDIRVGDWVWTKDQHDPDGELILQQVTQLFRSEADVLHRLELQDADGNIETITSTDEHPNYVESPSGGGWTEAEHLCVGDRLLQEDGSILTVRSSTLIDAPHTVMYNFEVAGAHTYFVSDNQGETDWAWVHNTCAGQHHLFPRAFGSSTKYKGDVLPHLTKSQHTKIHKKFSDFLQKETGHRFRSLSGENWREIFLAMQNYFNLPKTFINIWTTLLKPRN